MEDFFKYYHVQLFAKNFSLTNLSNINILLSRSSHFQSIVPSTIRLQIPTECAHLFPRLFLLRY